MIDWFWLAKSWQLLRPVAFQLDRWLARLYMSHFLTKQNSPLFHLEPLCKKVLSRSQTLKSRWWYLLHWIGQYPSWAECAIEISSTSDLASPTPHIAVPSVQHGHTVGAENGRYVLVNISSFIHIVTSLSMWQWILNYRQRQVPIHTFRRILIAI